MNKILRIVFNFVAILFTVLFFAEMMLIAFQYDYTPLKWQEPKEFVKGLGKTDWRLHHALYDGSCIYDNKLIWRPRKNQGLFNSQGFKGVELNFPKRSGEYRIFVLGDSNSAGPVQGPGWPEYLQEIFMEGDLPVTVTNAACWGYTSYQGLKRFEEIIKYEPDMVLISFGGNDAHRVEIPDEDYLKRTFWIPPSLKKLRLVRIGIALSDMFSMATKGHSDLKARVSLQQYKENLEKMVQLSKMHKIKVVFLTRPFIGSPDHSLNWKNFAPEYNLMTMKVAEENNAGFIDLYEKYKQKQEYFSDESHFTDEGFKVAAEIISPYLEAFCRARSGLKGWKRPIDIEK